jgi:hypothetical protein
VVELGSFRFHMGAHQEQGLVQLAEEVASAVSFWAPLHFGETQLRILAAALNQRIWVIQSLIVLMRTSQKLHLDQTLDDDWMWLWGEAANLKAGAHHF